MYEEKRRCHRLNIQLPVSFQVSSMAAHISVATTMDIGAKGVSLITTEQLHKGQALEIHLKLPDGEKLRVKAEVVWVKAAAVFSRNEYMAGLKLDETMQADEARFVRFYAEKLREFFSQK